MPARFRSAFLTTPFDSSQGRSARRICSENEMPSRSCRRRIASSRSSSSLSAVKISSGDADKPFRSSGHNKSELAVSRWRPECRTSILSRTESSQIDATLREIDENAVDRR